MSVSRSLVGSSSSSTLGSVASSRSICSRRRSPPDRSLTGVQMRLSVKPNTSASWPAESSRSPSLTRRATSSTASSSRRCPGSSLSSWDRNAARTVEPVTRRPPSGVESPASRRSRVVLPEPLAPRMAIRSPGPTCQVRSFEDRFRAGLERDVLQVVDLLAEPGGGHPLQADRVADRRHVGDQRVGRVDPELRLRGAGRRAAAQPGDLLAEQVLPAGLHGRGDPLAFGPGQGPGRVPALVGEHALVHDLPGRGAHRVEEPAVVGDHHERAAPGQQVAGQPVHAGHVQMVGGLVEDQQVGVADQQRGQGDPAAFATGHRPDRGLQPEVAHAEAVEDLPDAGVAGPLVLGAHAVGQPGGAQHHVPDGERRVQHEGLREGGDAQVTPVGDPAGVRVLGLGEHAQQGRLAGAVEADDPDAGVVVQPEGDVGEQLTGGAVALVDPVEIDDIGHDGSRLPARPASARAR